MPRDFPKWQSVYAYWSRWSESDGDGVGVLERAFKN
ncbi:transposase [Lampropedia puyangensis]|uniref:Transposase n=1 Tax=Lampropedia puyangensis TaxID=1330072 RepID=A0A4S8F9P0_9BURK|nr:transposase [Lampropedia puyangensis]